MFDPYHKWLGIPPGQRPPTHYQLLGIALDEQDRDVILEAAIRQTAHVRTYQIGAHGAECSRVLSEIIRARDTLLNPAKRKDYDAKLARAGLLTRPTGNAAEPSQAVPTAAAPNEFTALAAFASPGAAAESPADGNNLGIRSVLVRSQVPRAGRWPMKTLVAIGVALTVLAVVGDLLVLNGFFKRAPASDRTAEPPSREASPARRPETTGAAPRPAPAVRVEPKEEPALPAAPAVARGDALAVFDGRIDLPPRTLAFSPDGRQVVSAAGLEVWLWDVASRRFLRRLDGVEGLVNQAAFAPGGKYLVTAAGSLTQSGEKYKADGCALQVWDAATGKLVNHIEGPAPFYGLAFSPDGRQLLAGSGYAEPGDGGKPNLVDCEVRLIDLQTGKIVKNFPSPLGPVFQVAFGPNDRVLGAYLNNGVFVWDLRTGQDRPPLVLRETVVLVFAPDGKRVLGSGVVENNLDGTARVWSLEPLENTLTFRPSTPGVTILAKAFAPDGRHILLAGLATQKLDGKEIRGDYNLWLVSLETGKEVACLRGHTGPVVSLAFSPDGRYAVSGSDDRTIRLWDLAKYIHPGGPDRPPVQVVEKPGPMPKDPTPGPVPSETDQKAAERLVKELFADDYAKLRQPADRAALAAKLLQKGQETKDDPPARYVLLREARDLAADGGDVTTSLAAVDEMARGFRIDVLDAKTTALATASKLLTSPAANKGLAEQYLELVDVALVAEKFDAAERLVSLAEAAARRTQNPALVAHVQARGRTAGEFRKDAESAQAAVETLKQNPDDAEANLTAGRYLCLRKGDWVRGLPRLAKGSDAGLKAAARKELPAPGTPAGQVAAADAWWDLAEAEKGWAKRSLQARAVHWYERALPDLAGLAQTKAETRIKQLAEQTPATRLPSVAGEARQVLNQTGPLVSVSLNRDGSRVLGATSDGSVCLYDAETGKELLRPSELPGQIRSAALSPDGRHLFVSATGGRLVFDAKTGRELWRTGYFLYDRVAFADNVHLAMASSRGGIEVWTLLDGGTLRRVFGTSNATWGQIQNVALSPDSGLVAFVTEDGGVHIYNVATAGKKDVGRLRTTGQVACVTFTPDGRHLITGGADGVLRLWSVATGQVLRVWKGHTGRVTCVAISRDGNRLVSGSEDRTVRLWDGRGTREILRLDGHTDRVTCLALSADGRRAASGSDDRTVRLWRLP